MGDGRVDNDHPHLEATMTTAAKRFEVYHTTRFPRQIGTLNAGENLRALLYEYWFVGRQDGWTARGKRDQAIAHQNRTVASSDEGTSHYPGDEIANAIAQED